MRFFITGINGQLGHDVAEAACARGHEVYGSDITEAYSGIAKLNCQLKGYDRLDITDEKSTLSLILDIKPDVVVHCAAWTAVDKAEEDDCRDTVMRVNSDGTRNIAKACSQTGCKLIYISTDYVFDGEGTKPWKPDDKNYSPINQYGLSKLMGEEAVSELLDKYYIVRISWVFGLNGSNFVKTMMKLSKNHDTLRVVNDQIGLPTYTKDLAVLITDMAETGEYGYYHACNSGDYISWYDFACEIFRQSDTDINVVPVSTAEYGLSKAARPKNSRLDTGKLSENGYHTLPDWRDALKRYLAELKENC